MIGQGVPNDVNKTIGCVYILYCHTDTVWVLVNMKKQCLGPNMTEKLLNRLLNLNAYYETKQNKNLSLVSLFRSVLNKMPVSPRKSRLTDHDDTTGSPRKRSLLSHGHDDLDPVPGTSSLVPLVSKKHSSKMLKGEIV